LFSKDERNRQRGESTSESDLIEQRSRIYPKWNAFLDEDLDVKYEEC
jgi:hypothetical protein